MGEAASGRDHVFSERTGTYWPVSSFYSGALIPPVTVRYRLRRGRLRHDGQWWVSRLL